jgi:DHA1 family bicyclomycin/chloramphenicol resistance-like MFS transporter
MRKIPGWLPLLLGFLQAVGPVSTDMYLPAFPAIEASFHTGPGSAQVTLGTWFLGLAVGQLLQGTLADRFGRRGPLLLGTLLYTFGAVGCAMSGSMGAMAAWRFVAAVGGSASMVIPRAIVRDISEGHEQARLMSRLILVLGVAPILAPTLGGFLLGVTSWRSILWINAGYGALALLLAAWKLPDTLDPAARVPIHLTRMLARYVHIAGERGFITHVLMMSFYAFALFAYLGGSPTVFIDHYHFSPRNYALVFGSVSALYILCSQLNIRLVRRFDLDGTLTRVSWTYLFMASLLLLAAWRDVPPVLFILILALTHCQNGFLSPTGMVGALRHHGAQAGSASALMGTIQFTIGAFGGFFMGVFTNGTAVPMAGLIFFAGLVAKIIDMYRPKLKTAVTVH